MVNQILSIDDSQSTGKRSNGNIDIKKIAIFFGIVLAIFSVGLIGVGVYSLVNNNSIMQASKKAKIEAERSSDDDKLIVSIESEEELSKIVYVWSNDQREIEIPANEQKYMEISVELPVGTNTLKVTSYDVNGNTTEFENEYVVEAKKPQVSITPVNGKMKITANDKDKMSYITYRWDDEEETRIDATADSSAQITKEVEIPRGEHTLYVVAANSKNLIAEASQQVKGVTKPYINVVIDSDDPQMLILSVSDEEAIKEILIELNNDKYRINLSEYHQQSIQHRLKQAPGENNIKVTATNFDGAETIYEGKNTYNP